MTSMPDTIATLREAVTQLKAVIAPPMSFARVGRFTPCEETILSILLEREIATFEQIHQALFAGRTSDWPEDNIVKVHICRIRSKLSRYRIEVLSWYGRGYRMDPAGKARLRSLMEPAP